MRNAIFIALVFGVGLAQADFVDRPGGYRIGERLTLRPYVSLSYTYDSNNDQQKHGEGVSSWIVNPGLGVTYLGDNWSLEANAFYRYTAYSKYVRSLNQHSYGEDLKFVWTDSERNEKGWSLLITEKYQKLNQDDDMANNNGRGLWRDREIFTVEGALQRRFTDKFHVTAMGSYYNLDYGNDEMKYAALYGWSRWTAGGEIGYALSKWFDLVVTGAYMGYKQDNDGDRTGYSDYYANRHHYASDSDGWTLQAGFQSFLTDRIRYRLLGGWSRYKYANYKSINGFTYEGSLNWNMSERWNMMLLASSYYQPSEREYGCANRVDMVSWGLRHTMIRGRLSATLDLAYRRETREFTDESAWDYDEDIFSVRAGLDYRINRFLSAFGRLEYQGCWFSGSTGGVDRDYDRVRGTLGVRLTY